MKSGGRCAVCARSRQVRGMEGVVGGACREVPKVHAVNGAQCSSSSIGNNAIHYTYINGKA